MRPSNAAVEVLFQNQLDEPVHVIWIDLQGREVLIQTLKPRERITYAAFAANRFIFRDDAGKDLHAFRTTGNKQQVYPIYREIPPGIRVPGDS